MQIVYLMMYPIKKYYEWTDLFFLFCFVFCVHILYLEPEFIVWSVTAGSDTLKRSVLSGVHLHVAKAQEMRGFICNKQTNEGN